MERERGRNGLGNHKALRTVSEVGGVSKPRGSWQIGQPRAVESRFFCGLPPHFFALCNSGFIDGSGKSIFLRLHFNGGRQWRSLLIRCVATFANKV